MIVLASGCSCSTRTTSAGRPAAVANTSRKHFTAAAFHPSGRWLAATANDHTVKPFDASSWRVGRAYDWQVGRLRSVALGPDGTAAAGSDTGEVAVWDFDG